MKGPFLRKSESLKPELGERAGAEERPMEEAKEATSYLRASMSSSGFGGFLDLEIAILPRGGGGRRTAGGGGDG